MDEIKEADCGDEPSGIREAVASHSWQRRNIQHALDKFLGRFAQVTFPRVSIKQCSRNVLCDITRPSLGGVKRHHPYWVGVLAAADIAEDSSAFASSVFDIGATELAIVIEHNVHGDIVRLLVWS